LFPIYLPVLASEAVSSIIVIFAPASRAPLQGFVVVIFNDARAASPRPLFIIFVAILSARCSTPRLLASFLILVSRARPG
jgi:hypothetical protein